jgi:hypothetical protein
MAELLVSCWFTMWMASGGVKRGYVHKNLLLPDTK